MTPRRRRVLQVCLVILVISLVLMTISSIVGHGKVEVTNLVPFIGIIPVTVALIRGGNDKNGK